MNPHLLFGLKLPYIQTGYTLLKSIAIHTRSLGESQFLWIFQVKHVKDVISILGKTLEFEEIDVNTVLPYCPTLKETVKSKAEKQGKGKFEIIFKSPKVYVCETIRNKQVIKSYIPTENIMYAWEVMKNYALNKPIKSRTVARRIIEEIGITRFNREESETFSWEKFFGCRSDYHKYFYFPIKILQSEGVIEHHTCGMVERKTEDWDFQTSISEV